MAAVVLEDQVLRDGLQFEKKILSLEEKKRIFELLVDAGVSRIQVGSFVNPKRVPQMADTEELIRQIEAPPNLQLSGLVLNDKGLDRALACGLEHINMAVSASDTHSRKNSGLPADEALQSMSHLIARAASAGAKVRAGIMCAFGCVYEGNVPESTVLNAVETLSRAGAHSISLADTTGMGNPSQVRRLFGRTKERVPELPVSLHIHDTRGLGLANMFAAYEAGARSFDAASGGLGGCPFVKGASGNVPTEDAVHMFESMGIDTAIELSKLCQLVDYLEELFGWHLPGRMCHVLKAVGCV